MNSMRITISGASILRMAGVSFVLGVVLGIYVALLVGHHQREQDGTSSLAPVVHMHHSVSAVPEGLLAG
jgi:ABC-type nitrate/sulfonate/bicarbonate transport system permease component